jgi:hypothetical protein
MLTAGSHGLYEWLVTDRRLHVLKICQELVPVLAILISGPAAAQTASLNGGSVCVLPNSAERPTRISPGGDYNPDTLTVRIDKGQPLRWPHKEPVLIDELDLQGQHLVVLTSDGKRIQSFRFKFTEEDKAKLCIYFDGYQGVQLGDRKNALWCAAKTKACWH